MPFHDDGLLVVILGLGDELAIKEIFQRCSFFLEGFDRGGRRDGGLALLTRLSRRGWPCLAHGFLDPGDFAPSGRDRAKSPGSSLKQAPSLHRSVQHLLSLLAGPAMQQQDVYLWVFNGLSDWETGYAVAGIHGPTFQQHPGRYRVQTVAVGASPVVTAGGIRILPDVTLDQLSLEKKSAMLILPGGAAWEAEQNGEVLAWAGAFLKAGIPVAAICGATMGLARHGLLAGRRHTSNARDYLSATGYHGGEGYEESPAVTDGDLITASGLAPVDFARHIFQRLALYAPPVLEAWYQLFKTGQARYFAEWMQAAAASATAHA